MLRQGIILEKLQVEKEVYIIKNQKTKKELITLSKAHPSNHKLK